MRWNGPRAWGKLIFLKVHETQCDDEPWERIARRARIVPRNTRTYWAKPGSLHV